MGDRLALFTQDPVEFVRGVFSGVVNPEGPPLPGKSVFAAAWDISNTLRKHNDAFLRGQGEPVPPIRAQMHTMVSGFIRKHMIKQDYAD